MEAWAMINDETIREILRLKFRTGISDERIARQVGVSKTTVIEYVKDFARIVPEKELQKYAPTRSAGAAPKKFPSAWEKYIDVIIFEKSKRKKRSLTDDVEQMIFELSDILKTDSPTKIYEFMQESNKNDTDDLDGDQPPLYPNISVSSIWKILQKTKKIDYPDG
jgi:transcriptional regulator with XRE-family HTH domain